MDFTFITATPLSVAAGSGTTVAILGLRDGLTALGHRVTIVAPGWRDVGPWYALRRWWFNRTLRDGTGADVVVGFDMDGYAYAAPRAVTYVSVIYGQLADEARFERGVTRWSMQWQARFERRNVRRSDLVVAPSAYAARRLVDVYAVPAERIRIVPPAFDHDRWMRALAGAPRLSRAGPVVLAVARLYARKNLAALIAAAAPLARMTPGVQVRIVGEGPERPRLAEAIRRHGADGCVRLAGHLPFERLAAEFANADVFCLPSRQEGFGLVFLEAMAAGIPIVAARASSTPELVRDGVNGSLIDPGDPNAIAGALASLLADGARRAAMGRRNAEMARQFAPATIASRFLTAIAHGNLHRPAGVRVD